MSGGGLQEATKPGAVIYHNVCLVERNLSTLRILAGLRASMILPMSLYTFTCFEKNVGVLRRILYLYTELYYSSTVLLLLLLLCYSCYHRLRCARYPF